MTIARSARCLALTIALFAVLACSSLAHAQDTTRLEAEGLDQPVEILVDRWGVSHIYAETEHDLFFGQGWNAARDRLFQLELWRRQATGTVSEILGPRELQRDIGTRLFRFRRDLEQELNHYHENGVEIIGAYVEGINAYIRQTQRDPSLLPLEFELLGIAPGIWTPDVVVSRHQGLLGNIGAELRTGRLVAQVGAETVKDLSTFGPGDPLLELDPVLDGAALSDDILDLYNAFRGPIRFRPEDIAPEHRGDVDGFAILSSLRGLFPHLESVLMDQETLDSHLEYQVPGNGRAPSPPSNLKPHEAAAFQICASNNVRLEQERVLQQFATIALSEFVTDAT